MQINSFFVILWIHEFTSISMFVFSLNIQANDLSLQCEKIKKAEDTHALKIKYQKKQ